MTSLIDMDLLNETQKISAKRAIQTALRIGVIPVKFQKADGEIREMMATLNPGILTDLGIDITPKKPKDGIVKPENFEVVHIFDFDKKALRSFRMDRLVEVGSISAKELIIPVTSSI